MGRLVERGASWLSAFGVAGLLAGLLWAYVPSASISVIGQEQDTVFLVQRLLLGAPLYVEPTAPPFVLVQYGPILPHLCATLLRIVGVQPGNLHQIYVISRIVSAVAILAAALALTLFLRRAEGLSPPLAVSLGLLLPVAIAPWGFVIRPDALYLLFLLGGFLLALLYRRRPRVWVLVAGAALLAAAIQTKLTAIFFTPLAVLGCFVYAQGLRAKICHMALLGGVLMAGLLLSPPLMLRNYQTGLANGADYRLAMQAAYAPFLEFHWPLLVASVAALVYLWRAGADRAPLLTVLGGWTLAVAVATGVKIGSAENYFDELLMVALIACGVAAADLQRRWPQRRAALAGAILCATALYGAVLTAGHLTELRSGLRHRAAFYADEAGIAARLRRLGGPVLTLDEESLVFVPELATLAPYEVVAASVRAGHFDLAPVRGAIADGRLCWAVAPADGSAGTIMAPVTAQLLALFEEYGTLNGKALYRARSCRPTGAAGGATQRAGS